MFIHIHDFNIAPELSCVYTYKTIIHRTIAELPNNNINVQQIIVE